jgi:hypothetical protein
MVDGKRETMAASSTSKSGTGTKGWLEADVRRLLDERRQEASNA